MSNIMITTCPKCGKDGANRVIFTDPNYSLLSMTLHDIVKQYFPEGPRIRTQQRECVQCNRSYTMCLISQDVLNKIEIELRINIQTISDLKKQVDELTPKMKDIVLSKAKKREQLSLLDNVPTIPVKHSIEQYYPPINTRRT